MLVLKNRAISPQRAQAQEMNSEFIIQRSVSDV